MQEILNRLREYDLDEVRLLCEKFKQQKAAPGDMPNASGRRW